MLKTRYRAVAGYPGYCVGDDGSVWGCKTSAGPTDRWRRLRPARSNGYLVVDLYHNGQGRIHRIHRLVLTAFVGPCPPGLEACHTDGNKTNNRLNNLRWDTRHANMADRVKHGTSNRGVRHGQAILTPTIVRAIRKDGAAGLSHQTIAHKYGYNPTGVRNILTGRLWSHVA